MANRISTKTHLSPLALNYGGFYEKAFTVATINASQANTAAQDYLVLPIASKIPLVSVAFSSAANGVTAFNICIGSAAEAGVLVADNSDSGFYEPPTVNTTPGLCLFQTGTFPNFTGPGDQAIAVGTAYTSASFVASEPDAIFPQGTVLTLRIVSGATVNGGMKVGMIAIPVDLYPTKALTTGWTWANTNVG